MKKLFTIILLASLALSACNNTPPTDSNLDANIDAGENTNESSNTVSDPSSPSNADLSENTKSDANTDSDISTTDTIPTSTETKKQRTYRNRNPQACERIRYKCDEGQQAFSDTTGCGCEPSA